MNQELPDVQAEFRKHRGTRDQTANICWIIEKVKEFQKNTYFRFIGNTKAFDSVDHKNCGKFLKRWEHQTTLPASWENCLQVKKQQLEPDLEQQTGSKLGKDYIKAVYCHSALFSLYTKYLMWMPGWMKHKLELRLVGEISTTPDKQIIPF